MSDYNVQHFLELSEIELLRKQLHEARLEIEVLKGQNRRDQDEE